MVKASITVRQSALWMILYFLGNSFLLLPSAITPIARQDAWLSVILAVALQLLLIPMYVHISRQMKGRNAVEHLRHLFGEWLGNAVTLVFLIAVPLLIFMMTLRNLGDFISTSIAPDIPSETVYVLMGVAVYSAVRSGIQAVGRSAEILFWIIPLLYTLVTLTLLPDTNLSHLMPVYEFGWKPIFHASILLLGFPYMETILLLFLLPYMNKPKQWKQSIVLGTLLSGAMFLIMVVHVIAVLGADVASNLTYASYFVVRTISIANFLERFEIIVTIFWYVSIFFRLVLLMLILVNGFSSVLRIREPHTIAVPILLFAVILTHYIWPNQAYILETNQIWPFYAACYGIVFPLVIWILGIVRE